MFRGSSVLIVFEGDAQLHGRYIDQDESKHRSSNLLQVKLIDFVHVWESSAVDINYLEGITSLIGYLSSLSTLFDSCVDNTS